MSEFKKNKIQNFQTTSDGKSTKINVIGLEKLWNFVVNNLLILNHLVKQNYVWVLKLDFLTSHEKPPKLKL
jgi:hypothetical protein